MSIRVFLSALVLSVVSVQASADGVEGMWASAPSEETGGHIEVEITACEKDPAMRCGVIKHYFKNGEPAESDIVGKSIIEKMESAGDKMWKNGTIWAPDDDKTYSAKMELLSDNTLKVSGCVLRFICRGQEWTRVQN